MSGNKIGVPVPEGQVFNPARWGNFKSKHPHDQALVSCVERTGAEIDDGVRRGLPLGIVAPSVLGKNLSEFGNELSMVRLAMNIFMSQDIFKHGARFSDWVKSAENRCITCNRPGIGNGCSRSNSGWCKYTPSKWVAFGEPFRRA
jgi:hypothetical protein